LPQPTALKILEQIDDPRFTNELALYNLEVNLSPRKLGGRCFSAVAQELEECLQTGQAAARQVDSNLLLTGILPTLNFRHLLFQYMTPEERYRILSQELLKIRGRNFEIFLEGVDDFNTELDSVLFEACNTSFQLHLQIDPAEFVHMHNWAQLISGPVLAAATNSPLLFGKELWAENRIALFKQSLDTRNKRNFSRVMMPRVYFGSDWLRSSPIELWKKDVVRFPLLLQGYGDDDPMECLEKGIAPKLKSVRLHNGTTYTWNRLCYGIANNSPHIRIECRYLPAGPSMIDEVANFAFWIGLMKAAPEPDAISWPDLDFRSTKCNFMKAAHHGLHTVQAWFGRYYSTKELILNQLLPMAAEGLQRMQVDGADIDGFLGIIRDRVSAEQTGSIWQKHNFRQLIRRFKPSVATEILVQRSVEYQAANVPVHLWEDIDVAPVHPVAPQWQFANQKVEDIMNKEVITTRENVSVEIIRKVLEWRGFNHLPIEDEKGELSGMISSTLLESGVFAPDTLARDIMVRGVISVGPEDPIEEAINVMKTHTIHCLPVVEHNAIVGILTQTDIKDWQRERRFEEE
jgi:CBS domain-containing protein